MINMSKLEKLHPTFSHTQNLIDICNPLKLLNITSFAHAKMHSNSYSLLTNNFTFMKNYVSNQYHRVDISTDPKYCNLLNCIMWDTINAKGKTATLLHDAAYHQHGHPFSIIKKSSTHVDAYTFGTDVKNDSFNQIYVNNYDLLENFIDYFNQVVFNSKDLKLAYEFEFENADGANEHESSIVLDQSTRGEFYNQIYQKRFNYNFTDREMECIPMILRGLTANEIGKKLFISSRTVESHIVSLKRKIGARNKEELIIKLLINKQLH